MCGRFETKPSVQSLIAALRKEGVEIELSLDDEKNKAVNIAPTDKIFTITYSESKYVLSFSNWGIKFKPDSHLIFNSRIETINEKPFWQNLFDKNRALVPMSGFYEWKKEGSRKTPYRIFLPDTDIFFVPALFIADKEGNVNASLITTVPNDFIKPIHHRMPVIFKIKEGIEYLKNDIVTNKSICLPYKNVMSMEKAALSENYTNFFN